MQRKKEIGKIIDFLESDNDEKLVINDGDSLRWSREKSNEIKKRNPHWGQLKLFLSEIMHISRYEHTHIIYAGAAPGIHIVPMAKMMREKMFYLFDPNPIWDVRLFDLENVMIFTKKFDPTDIDSDIRTNCFLISDIRNTNIEYAKKTRNEEMQDEIVAEDMTTQFDFWKELQPDIALFKFRLPRYDGISIYPKGDIYLPIYGKHDTSESRLLVKKNASNYEYNNQLYRDRLFYYHVHNRNDAAMAAKVINLTACALHIDAHEIISYINELYYCRR